MIDGLRTALDSFGIPHATADAAVAAMSDVTEAWQQRDADALPVTAKVVAAFSKAGITEAHLQGTTGYGYHDFGREAYEAIFADVMDAQAALARVQLASGTHAIVATIGALVRPGDTIASLTGRPYDTLRTALVDHPSSPFAQGRDYHEAPWGVDDRFDERAVIEVLRRNPAVAFVQRSRGYAPRASMSVEEIERLVKIVRREAPRTVVVVDNCYGEFVERREPCAAGADAVVGSLIKNPGGGHAPTGAYVAGSAEVVARVADRIFAPGLGNAMGPSLEALRWLFAGLHRAPKTVAESLKILDFAAAIFARLGYEVDPHAGDARTDIIQAIRLGSAEKIMAFAAGLQRMLPVSSRAVPEPGQVPGYSDPVVMAGGAFVSGATMELSCDAPLRAPYDVYLQGGMDCAHGVFAVTSAAAAVAQCGPR